ncbi:hypothetical protein R5R35_009297 [Gryllus longicercus]|uniref:Aromatic-L-amino-acid decarboxylase n=1 Tax=Gryllus longicercus TaxID=2509291 RepID=A0AAN9W6P9_9ORTH
MDAREFIDFAGAAAEYIADYLTSVRDRRVLPAVEPGYLRDLLPEAAPERPEHWRHVLADVERVIMPGMTHWQSPRFHAYYPTGSSFAAMVGEMLSAGLGCIGFSWAASPVATELETHMMDWLARLLALPEHFLNAAPGPGGGVLQGSASEATLVALLAAKERTVRRLLEEQPEQDAALLKTRLVAYTCDQANSSVEKAGLLASLPMRLLPSDAQGRLRADVLQRAVDEDRANGLLPCFVVATLGSTPTCAFDPLPELGQLCQRERLWLHVDAAYAGTALLCPEYRHIAEGAELADSFCVNPHKWMLINFDCSAMWVRDSHQLVEAFTVDRIYLAHHKQGLAPDYRNWQIPLGRRFRALKLWLVLRLHGAEGLRAHVRHQVALARHFEALARAHAAVHVATVALGLVCFRLQGPEALTEELLAALRTRGRIYVVAGAAEGRLVIRFCICSRLTRAADVDFAWEEIRQQAEAVLRAHGLANGVANDDTAAHVNGEVNRLTKGIVNGVTVTNGFTKSDANGAAHGFATSDSDADGAESEIPMVADMVTSQPPLPSAECKAV